MPAPRKGHIKWVIYVPPELKQAVQEEGKARKMTMGEMVEEAFKSRVRLIRR